MTGSRALRSRPGAARPYLAYLSGPLLSVALMAAVPDELPMPWVLLVTVGVVAVTLALLWVSIDWARSIIRAATAKTSGASPS